MQFGSIESYNTTIRNFRSELKSSNPNVRLKTEEYFTLAPDPIPHGMLKHRIIGTMWDLMILLAKSGEEIAEIEDEDELTRVTTTSDNK